MSRLISLSVPVALAAWGLEVCSIDEMLLIRLPCSGAVRGGSRPGMRNDSAQVGGVESAGSTVIGIGASHQ